MLLNFKRYRDIILYRILAQIKSEARQFYLGYLWFALEPLLMTGIFFVVFGVLLESRSVEYLWFLICGMIAWQWFEAAVNEGMLGIKIKLHILSQIPLPKTIFPLVHVGSATWKFICVLMVLLVARLVTGNAWSPSLLALPLIMLIQLGMIVGLAWLLSIAVSYFEDTQKLVQAFLRLFFYLSGIFFAAERIPVELQGVFYANPMAGLLEAYRAVIVDGFWPDSGRLVYAAIWAVGLMAVGYAVSSKYDKRLMKEVVA